MKTIFVLLFSLNLTANVTASELGVVDSTSCFLFMEVISNQNLGINIYHGNGTLEHIDVTLDSNKDDKEPYYVSYGIAVAQVINKLYNEGWVLVKVMEQYYRTDDEKSYMRPVPRYYYFERKGCQED